MSTHDLRRPVLVLAVLAGLGSLAACGDDDGTGPEGSGTMSAAMTDENGSAAVASRGAASSGQASYSGTFDGEVQVQISTDGETWVDVGAPGSVSVDLQSSGQTTVQSDVEVEAGDYSRVRVVMSGASANLDAGAVLGGTEFSSAVSVSVGGGSEVTVEKQIVQFRVSSDTDILLVVDLNSEAWITSESAESGSASEAEVESAMAVDARAG